MHSFNAGVPRTHSSRTEILLTKMTFKPYSHWLWTQFQTFLFPSHKYLLNLKLRAENYEGLLISEPNRMRKNSVRGP